MAVNTKAELKEALLKGKVETLEGQVVPATILTNNMFLECSIMRSLWKSFEEGEIYVVD